MERQIGRAVMSGSEPLVLTTKAGVAYREERAAEVSIQVGIYPGVVLLNINEADDDNSGGGWLDKDMLQQHIEHCLQMLAQL